MVTNINKQSGVIITTLLMLIITISSLVLIITQVSIENYQYSVRQVDRVSAQLAADTGLDIGISELNKDETWLGVAETEYYQTSKSKITYQIEIVDTVDPDKKIVRATGKSYSPASSTTPDSTRTFELEAAAVTSGFGPGSVVSGVGGLVLNNNSKITGGDVIVNGRVTISNGAQIGLSTNPVNLRVANQSCPSPANATYPQVCATGQPISNSGLIYGDVQAQNQTTNTGMSNPGLTSNVFAPIAVPGYNRTAHKAAVAATYAPNNAAVSCGNNQTKTWAANIKITGNVSLGNNCVVTVLGNVWITGNLSFGNNSTIVIGTTGTNRPVIMIDGATGLVTGNNSRFNPNSSGTGAEVITTWWNTTTSTNGNFNCGGIADLLDCSAVTGLALSTSQSVTTINLSNNTNASNTIFRTLWSRVVISNNGALGAVAGQTIQLGNNAIINFTATIAGSDNLTKTWVKRGYLRVYR